MNLNTVGGRLMIARRRKGWTQKEMAELLNEQHGIATDQSFWSHVENGRRGISMPVFVAVADLLEVSLDYLTGRAKQEEQKHEVEYAA
jgi:transcriptional regulator with XRE-family HTH domain